MLILLDCLPEPLRHSLAVDTWILLEVGIRGLGELVVDELDDLGIVVAHLRNFVDEVGFGRRQNGERDVDFELFIVLLDDCARLAQQAQQELVQHHNIII